MFSDSKPFDPNSAEPVPGKKTQVTIHVISGQQLPKPPQSMLGDRGEVRCMQIKSGFFFNAKSIFYLICWLLYSVSQNKVPLSKKKY